MTDIIEINVPDIGDATDVDVIEVLVNVGDTIEQEQSLITVESDKASMEIPSTSAGVVREIAVKLGDKVSQGSLVLLLESQASKAPKAAEQPANNQASKPAPSAAPVAADGNAINCDVLVLGAGPGGYSAAFRAADLGKNVVLVERYSTLGGVCLNVGCIPSKALLHTVGVLESARELSKQGITFSEPTIDIDALRSHKDSVVSKLTNGLAGMAKARKVQVVVGNGQFLDKNNLVVTNENGESQTIRFEHAIIAAGSQSIKLPFLPEDERVIDSTGALQLKAIPKSMLVIGGGIIGLEMATVYSALGARVDVVEMQSEIMQGPDRDLVKVWQKMNDHRFDRIMLETSTVSATAEKDGIAVTFSGKNAPEEPQVYDLVLQSVGRKPNGNNIGAENAGVNVDERGFIAVDSQMRTNVDNIFAIGDIVGQPMLAHKAVHEAHVAAQAIAGEKSHFDARVIPSVAYTDPEVAWVGLTETQAKEQGLQVEKGLFPWAASGRAIANTRDEGFTKLIFDANTKQIVGGAIVGTNAGDMIGEVALAIEMGADNVDIASTIHPHPTLGESIGMAAAALEGACTDLPPARKRK